MNLKTSRRRVLVYNFLTLTTLYFNMILVFSLIYLLMEIGELGLLKDNQQQVPASNHWLNKLGTAIYFSGMTIVSGGYGDIIPIGWSRFIAMVEAVIGLVLPVAIVINYILFPGLYARYLRKVIRAVVIKKSSSI